MIDTLREYIDREEIEKITEEEDLIMKIGGKRSQYYAACHAIAEVMLNVYDEKRRCVIFHGISDSGKSFIADLMEEIFDSHKKNDTKDKFDELITP